MSGADESTDSHADNAAVPVFVSPRTLLEPSRPVLPPRAFTALDKEQLEGLVGGILSYTYDHRADGDRKQFVLSSGPGRAMMCYLSATASLCSTRR